VCALAYDRIALAGFVPQSAASPSSAKWEAQSPPVRLKRQPGRLPYGRPVGFASPPRDGFASFPTSDVYGHGPYLMHTWEKARKRSYVQRLAGLQEQPRCQSPASRHLR
jgi:hypothetical protein